MSGRFNTLIWHLIIRLLSRV